MFWSDPNLYGATMPYKDIPHPMTMGPWHNTLRFLPPTYGFVPPYYNLAPQTFPTFSPFLRPEATIPFLRPETVPPFLPPQMTVNPFLQPYNALRPETIPPFLPPQMTVNPFLQPYNVPRPVTF